MVSSVQRNQEQFQKVKATKQVHDLKNVKLHDKEQHHHKDVVAANARRMNTMLSAKLASGVQASIQAVRSRIAFLSQRASKTEAEAGLAKKQGSAAEKAASDPNQQVAADAQASNAKIIRLTDVAQSQKSEQATQNKVLSPGEHAKAIAQDLKASGLIDGVRGARSLQLGYSADGGASTRFSVKDLVKMGLSHAEIIARRAAEVALVVFEFLSVHSLVLKRLSRARKEKSGPDGKLLPMSPTHDELARQMRFAQFLELAEYSEEQSPEEEAPAA